MKKNLLLVKSNEINISSEDYPVIATHSLGPCMAFVLYTKEHQKAIVGHIPKDNIINDLYLDEMRLEIYKIIVLNKLQNANFELSLIDGAYKSEQEYLFHEFEILKNSTKTKFKPLDILEENIKKVKSLKISFVNKTDFPNDAFQIVDEYNNLNYKEGATLSKQFAFDAITGKFVTNEYFIPNTQPILSTSPKKR